MRSRIEALMSHRALWQSTGRRALNAFAQRYSVDRTIDAYEGLIEEVLARRGEHQLRGEPA
jgi:glycosyltransferase involved in cell wall biosynthesis